jgi:hypothetical protein
MFRVHIDIPPPIERGIHSPAEKPPADEGGTPHTATSPSSITPGTGFPSPGASGKPSGLLGNLFPPPSGFSPIQLPGDATNYYIKDSSGNGPRTLYTYDPQTSKYKQTSKQAVPDGSGGGKLDDGLKGGMWRPWGGHSVGSNPSGADSSHQQAAASSGATTPGQVNTTEPLPPANRQPIPSSSMSTAAQMTMSQRLESVSTEAGIKTAPSGNYYISINRPSDIEVKREQLPNLAPASSNYGRPVRNAAKDLIADVLKNNGYQVSAKEQYLDAIASNGKTFHIYPVVSSGRGNPRSVPIVVRESSGWPVADGGNFVAVVVRLAPKTEGNTQTPAMLGGIGFFHVADN